jgi:ATP-dependent DNA ligase
MSVLTAFEAMEAAALGNARLEALSKADSPELRELLTLALSPQVTFGVKKLPKYEDKGDSFGSGMSWSHRLKGLLKQLQTRELSGNAAQTEIKRFLDFCNPVEAKWAERIIKQDLRLNLGAKDVNNVFGEGTIFQFGVPLAEDFAKVDPKHYKGRWCVEPKLDGARCVAYLPANKGKVVLYSRSGKEYINFESVRTKLQEINDTRNPVQSIVLDGEVVSYVDEKIDFQALQHTLFRKDGVESGKLRFLVFDGSTQQDWEKPTKTYEERYRFIAEFISTNLQNVPGSISKLGLVEMFTTTDPDRDRMLKHSQEYVLRGFEGAMFRKADEKVLLKRSRSLMKVKSFADDEATLLGMVGGTGKYEGILGALQCKTKTGVEFEIGSGFTDEQRRTFWRDREKLPKLVNFKYQELTDDGVPRFPIFKGFRSEDDT